eukprot:gnl/TRDRNA2_/TRDRNA2_90619_c0_seq1.p1 gnl/TRDRNA2_/TRDRNA2_90619_c0~~gnl/TRDRNA2_/TRDRNA2_90619_c0_seq1.p1  ORF type:complete len:244 (-),score=84.05 gnl/TRDRNA2_/TRDRNA2_90619_c0_seq1:102-833(-)
MHNGKAKSLTQILHVDCTKQESKMLCEQHGAKGFPMIRYYNGQTPQIGEEYKGLKDLESLKRMARDLSVGGCDIETSKNCNEEQRAFIDEMKKMSEEEIDDMLKGWEDSKMELTNAFHELREGYELKVTAAQKAAEPVKEAEQNITEYRQELTWKQKLVDLKKGVKQLTLAEKIEQAEEEKERQRLLYAEYQAKQKAAREEYIEQMKKEMEENRTRMQQEKEEEAAKQKELEKEKEMGDTVEL